MHNQVMSDAFDAVKQVPDGPTGYPIVGLIPRLMRDILGTYREAAQYGDLVTMDLGPSKAYLLVHPDHFRHVLQDNYRNYIKGRQLESIKPLLGNGLFLAEGDFWFTQRRLMQPAFYRPALAGLADLMVNAAQMVLDRWADTPADKPVNMMYEMRQITQTVIVQAMFSTSISREETDAAGAALDFALSKLIERSIVPFSAPEWLPTAANIRLRRSMETLDNLVYRFIEERRQKIAASADGFDPTGDLLSMLLNVRYEDTGEGMSDQQLRDEVMTMFLAGHETTANTLTWVWYLLSQHPEVEAKLHNELAQVLSGRAPAFADLNDLSYTRMVIEETLRLYSPVWMTAREALADDVIGGYYVPAGSMLMLGFFLLHTDPRWWENPQNFDPERFSPERLAERPRYTYLPFGRGPRVCIGEHFAMMEAQLVLALIAQRYRPRLTPGQEVKLRPMGTLQPLKGPFMTVEAR